jgi:hypothetical protein
MKRLRAVVVVSDPVVCLVDIWSDRRATRKGVVARKRHFVEKIFELSEAELIRVPAHVGIASHRIVGGDLRRMDDGRSGRTLAGIKFFVWFSKISPRVENRLGARASHGTRLGHLGRKKSYFEFYDRSLEDIYDELAYTIVGRFV